MVRRGEIRSQEDNRKKWICLIYYVDLGLICQLCLGILKFLCGKWFYFVFCDFRGENQDQIVDILIGCQKVFQQRDFLKLE